MSYLFFAARKRRKPWTIHLFFGPPSWENHIWPHIIAHENGGELTTWRQVPVLERTGDWQALLTNLEPNDVIVCRWNSFDWSPVGWRKCFYPAMEDYQNRYHDWWRTRSTFDLSWILEPFTFSRSPTTRQVSLTSHTGSFWHCAAIGNFIMLLNFKYDCCNEAHVFLGVTLDNCGPGEIAHRHEETPRMLTGFCGG